MKLSSLIVIVGLFTFSCQSPKQTNEEVSSHDHANYDADKPAEEKKKKPLSPHTSTMANVGDNHVHIDYSSPGKRGRMIFGGLVGFGQVWSTGAHNATFINFGKDVTVGEVNILAGKYGLFTIPGESEWTIILSKDWDMHLADDYKEANDIVRIKVPAQKLNEVVESLTFEVTEISKKEGEIAIMWDQTKVAFRLKN